MDWKQDGVTLPPSTLLRMEYRRTYHDAKILSGTIRFTSGPRTGSVATSLSDAAKIATGKAQNGWYTWLAKRPGDRCWYQMGWLRAGLPDDSLID